VTSPSRSPAAIAALTVTALACFAANSLLARLALTHAAIDAASFTAVRLGSGAVILGLLVVRRGGGGRAALVGGGGGLHGAALLFAYAAPFAFAYRRIGAGLGALILFGAVQATMIGWGIVRGERPRLRDWAALALALGGLAVLALPGAKAPEPTAVAMMIAAGVAWGAYSLRGRGQADPLAATAGNFVCAVPMAVALLAYPPHLFEAHASIAGLGLALASGALASGVGYTLWYAVLPALSATRAALVQLAVPIVAASAAIPLLDERPTARLAIAAALIASGVGLALTPRRG
jgi:drug/metabolite transporter (DMT)-like permease